MLSFREIQNHDGYYYNLQTGAVLRNVGPGEGRCWPGAFPQTAATEDLDAPQFALLTADVLTPVMVVRQIVVARYGRLPPNYFLNRQVALLPDGGVVTEEALEELGTSRHSGEPSVREEAA